MLGLLEAFAASYLSLLTGGDFGAEYKDIFAFSVLILILIFRPEGSGRGGAGASVILRAALAIGLLALSGVAVAVFPRSVLVPALRASLLVIYLARIPAWLGGAPRGGAAGGDADHRRPGAYLEVATQVGIFVALALGLNIVVGLAGLLDLGYVAFYAVGAYAWAIFGSPQANAIFGSGFPLAPWFYAFLLVGLAVAGTTGVLLGLPVLRIRGDYLAIVTLGFGEVIRVLANNLDQPINFTNGPRASRRSDAARDPGALLRRFFYFLVLLIVVVVVIVNRRLEDSHIGRAWEAMREDELAAQAMGVPARAHEAARLRHRRLLRRDHGRRVLGQAGLHQPRVLHLPRVDRRPRDGDPGRHGLDPRGHAGRSGGDGPEPPAAEGLLPLAQRAQERRRHRVRLRPGRPADPVRAGEVRADDLRIILILMMIFRPQGILPAPPPASWRAARDEQHPAVRGGGK